MKCGYSKKCITPPIGYPIAGGPEPKFADGITDDLYTRATVFFDGEKYVALIAIDLCYMPTEVFDEARRRISEGLGIDINAIIITCSHTHSGPKMHPQDWWGATTDDEAYIEDVESKIFAAAREAFENLYECKMYTARGEAKGVSFIRRYRMKDGSVATNPEIDDPNILEALGTPNETVKLVKIARDGANDIFIVNFGTHSCTVGGNKISADYPGVICELIEGAIPGSECMFTLSAAGDANHVNVHPSELEKQIRKEDKINPGTKRLRAKYIAYAVAGEVLKICQRVEEIKSDKINFGMQEISVPSNKGGDIEEAKRIVELQRAGRSNELPYREMALITAVTNAARVIRMQTAPDFYKYKLFALSVGDLVFAGLPGEPFTEIGNRVMDASPFGEVIVCTITNAMSAYFLTSEAMKEGGYEAATSNIGMGADDIMVDGMKKLYSELKG